MTPKQREEMKERKRLAYARRLRDLRDKHGLPALTNRQSSILLDMVMQIEGDAVNDPDMLVLHRLVNRGLCGT